MCNETISEEVKCVYIHDNSKYTREVELIDAFIAIVEDKKLLSQVLPKLATDSSLIHLRRIHNGSIILGPSNEEIERNAREVFDSSNCKFSLQSIQVPICAPLTRVQYDFCLKFWPVKFREDTELEQKMAGTYFSATTLQLLRQLMDEAFESDTCIITTNSYQIIGRASESRMAKEEPLKHPFMRAFDSLTQSHVVAPKRSISGEQYYGTDCIVFIYDEPCAMCAMAMVHARVKMVFFKRTSTKGALLTNCQLHLKPQLNHHYDAFQLLY